MKKNNWTLVILIISGLLTGTLLAHAVSVWSGWEWLAQGMPFQWHPKADFGFLAYDLALNIQLNIGSIAGVVVAVWMFRRW